MTALAVATGWTTGTLTAPTAVRMALQQETERLWRYRPLSMCLDLGFDPQDQRLRGGDIFAQLASSAGTVSIIRCSIARA